MSIRLVILDVEGVLTPAGGGEHPWDLAALLRVRTLLADRGTPAVLCTGRQAPYGEAVIQALSLFSPLPEAVRSRMIQESGEAFLSWPSVTENGGILYDPLAKRPVPHPALTQEKIAALRRLRAEVLEPLARRTGAVVEVGKEFCVSLNPPLLAAGSPERQSTDEFRPAVDQACAGWEELVEIRHSRSAIDVTPRGISKVSAVELLLRWSGMTPDEVLGVGDTPADAQWLAAVGNRAAPANGRAHLPGLDFYATGEGPDGLLEILRQFL